jgi:hypothetical protein
MRNEKESKFIENEEEYRSLANYILHKMTKTNYNLQGNQQFENIQRNLQEDPDTCIQV